MVFNVKQEAEPKPAVKVPKELIPSNIGKIVEVSVYLRCDDKILSDSFEKYVGGLESFYHNKEGMIINIQRFPQIVTGWRQHHVVVTTYGKNLP
jgi:hypothetical protein